MLIWNFVIFRIPKDVRAAVYSHAVSVGGEDVWEFLWQRYLNANLSTERNYILRALAATKEIWLLNRYVTCLIDLLMFSKSTRKIVILFYISILLD